jgi:hypothetical protein
MSDVFYTVLSGVGVFVLGQIFIKFFIEPIHELYRLKGEIADALIFYANVPPDGRLKLVKKPSEDFRRFSSQLMAKKHMIQFYDFWAIFRIVPTKNNILKAHSACIGMSNGLLDSQDPDYTSVCRRDIEKALGLDTGR